MIYPFASIFGLHVASPQRGPYAAKTASLHSISSQAAASTFSSSLYDRMRTTFVEAARVSAKFRSDLSARNAIAGSVGLSKENRPLRSNFPNCSSIQARAIESGVTSGTECPLPHTHITHTPLNAPRDGQAGSNRDIHQLINVNVVHLDDGSVSRPEVAVPYTDVRATFATNRNGSLSGAALLFPVSGGAASQAVRNLSRLPEGLGFASPGRLRKRIKSPVHHLPVGKTDGNDLGHAFVSYPSGKPARPRLVSL